MARGMLSAACSVLRIMAPPAQRRQCVGKVLVVGRLSTKYDYGRVR